MPGYFFKGSRWIGGALCSILLLFLGIPIPLIILVGLFSHF